MAQVRARKVTEYGAQLQEKQKVKQSYGLREAQFRRLFKLAGKNRAQAGLTILQLLERRLDNVVFRAGLAFTLKHARQLLNHRHFRLNDLRVSSASTLVKKGDVITAQNAKKVSIQQGLAPAPWLKVDKKKLQVSVVRLPEAEDLPQEFEPEKIIAFYSR